jgi:hypothetical protein
VRIIGQPFTGELSVKRLSLPGVFIETECQACITPHRREVVLSHPKVNTPRAVYLSFCCEVCEAEWEEVLTVTITIHGGLNDLLS